MRTTDEGGTENEPMVGSSTNCASYELGLTEGDCSRVAYKKDRPRYTVAFLDRASLSVTSGELDSAEMSVGQVITSR